MLKKTVAAVSAAALLYLTALATAIYAQEPAQQAVIVILYSQHCKAYCQKVRPILQELKQQYPKIAFLELDTSSETLPESKAKAKELGRSVLQFVTDYADVVPYVGFFNSKRKLVKDLSGPKTKELYVSVIEKNLSGDN